jgi:hypothetical protein
MCFFTESEADLAAITLVANAADLRNPAAAASRLLAAFLAFTGENAPLRYVGVRPTSTGFGVTSTKLTVPFSKDFPPGYTQYKWKSGNPAEAPHFYIVYVLSIPLLDRYVQLTCECVVLPIPLVGGGTLRA